MSDEIAKQLWALIEIDRQGRKTDVVSEKFTALLEAMKREKQPLCGTIDKYECLPFVHALIIDDLQNHFICLIESGVKVDLNERSKDFFRSAPLHVVKSDAFVELLVKAGADVNATNKREMTPLHFAVIRDLINGAKILLAQKVDVHAQDSNAATPMHCVCSAEMAKLLLDAGGLLDLRDKQGNTPLLCAAANGVEAVDCEDESLSEDVCSMIQLLVKMGADLFATNCNGEDVLHVARAGGSDNFDFALLRALFVVNGVSLGVYRQRNESKEFVETNKSVISASRNVETVRSLLVAGVQFTAGDLKHIYDQHTKDNVQSLMIALNLTDGERFARLIESDKLRFFETIEDNLIAVEMKEMANAKEQWSRALWRWTKERVLALSLVFGRLLPTLIVVEICIWDQVWLNQVDHYLMVDVVEKVRQGKKET